jgi:hypothetical protein
MGKATNEIFCIRKTGDYQAGREKRSACQADVGRAERYIGRRLRFSVPEFWNDIKDRQQTVSLKTGGFLIENHDVRIEGIELEFAWHPITGLQLWGNKALNDGKYTGTDSAVWYEYSGAAYIELTLSSVPHSEIFSTVKQGHMARNFVCVG